MTDSKYPINKKTKNKIRNALKGRKLSKERVKNQTLAIREAKGR